MHRATARLLLISALAGVMGAGSTRAAEDGAPQPAGRGTAGAAQDAVAADGAPLDRARLGMTEGEVRKIYGAALKPQKIERAFAPARRSTLEPERMNGQGGASPPAGEKPKAPPAGKVDPWEGQSAWYRTPGAGDMAYVEYFFYEGRLYRVRWTLADRFKRPIMAELVALGTKRYGDPFYDQNIIWKPGDPRANLRRAAWQRDGKSLEIRMLNPTIGGNLYLTVADQAAIQAIVAAGGMAAPEPETAGSWWYAPHAKPRVVSPQELRTLLEAFGGLLGRSGY